MQQTEAIKVVIVGAGAIGSSLGGQLCRGGMDVTLVDVWADHIDQINGNGLRLITPEWEELIDVKATTDISAVSVADVVIIQCKSLHTASAIRAAAPLFGPETVALTFQNGLGNEETIAEVIGPGRVFAGLTMNGADVVRPGVVRSFSALPIHIGEYAGGLSERAHRVAGAFSDAGVPTVASPDIMREKWAKLLLNVGMSAISAITGFTIGQMIDTLPVRELVMETTLEAIGVAKAAGYTFTFDECMAAIMRLADDPSARQNTSSSCIDLRNKRATEVDFINGAIVRIGKQHGLAAPISATQVALVHGLESLFLTQN